MIDKRIVSLALALGMLLSSIGSAFAMPVDDPATDQLPPGLAKKTFIHYDKEFAKRAFGLQTMAAAATEQTCAQSGSPTCQTFVYAGTHWNAGTRVGYYVNANFNARKNPGLTQADATKAIDASFQTWQSKMPTSGGITYVNRGSTKLAPGKSDGRNVVGWGALSSGTLAVTTVWYYPSTGQIVETDIAFNSFYKWAYTAPAPAECDVATVSCDLAPTGPAGTYDLRNIGTHEAGHTLMLGDLYNASNSGLTMYGYGSANERAKESLGTGDILGVAAAYAG